MEDSLAKMASARSNDQVQLQISTAIFNQVQQQQQTQATALVRMISGMSLDGTGQLIDKYA